MIIEADLLSHWVLEGLGIEVKEHLHSHLVLRDPWEQVPPSYMNSPSTISEFPQSMVTPEEGTKGKACLLKSHNGTYLTSGHF